MAIVRVAIIKRRKNDYLVRPSVVFLKRTDTLSVINTTTDAFTLGKNLGGTVNSQFFLDLKRTLSPRLPLYQAIPYTVVNPRGVKAKGDSDPVIIIDR